MLALAGIGNADAAVCGDADGNGVVTTSDGVDVLRGAAELADCALDRCDVDRNGSVTVTDGVLTLRRAAGLPIVDHCGTGTVSGRLLVLPAETATAQVRREHEPNDGPGTADVAGFIAAGTVRRFTGTIGDDDPFDGYAFAVAAGVTLDLTLAFPAAPGVDLDLLVDDRRGDDATCESAKRGRERCRVAIGTRVSHVFDVVVVPASGSRPAAYTLTVRARDAKEIDGITAGPGAGTPLGVEPAVYRGEAAPIVTGEVVLRMGAATDPTGVVMRRALAAAAARSGLDEELTPEVVAPDGTVLATLPTVVQSAAGTGDRAAGAINRYAAKSAHAAARARTRAAARALGAEPNHVVRPCRVPRDPFFADQWHLDAIDLPAAWDVTIGSPSAIVAVIDTGIRSDHPDFAGRLLPGFDFISNPMRANDGDGIDPDPFDPGDQPTTDDGGTYHGTHVAGTIAAATDNAHGVAGVTWRTGLMPLRVLGIGGGTIFDVAQAIRYAAGLSNVSGATPPRRADVINLSLTTSNDDAILRDAVDAASAAGVLVVAAAGNTGSDAFLSPAGFANVVSVTATDRLGAPARYSSFGAAVDIAAPGGDTHHDRDASGNPDGVLSTLLPGHQDYGLLQGTSMASAHVSGVAALLLGVPGGASAEHLRAILLATADDRGASGRDDRFGAGLVDAARAVRMLAGLPEPTDPELALDTNRLRVAADESAPRVPFRNVGGGTLVISAPTATTDDGGAWLGAFFDGAGVRVSVDRDTLEPGIHQGVVSLDSNGGTAAIAVLAEVSAGPPEDVGTVTVLLRDPTSHAIAAATTTDVARDYRYSFAEVAPGTYEIVATTDLDQNGEICDTGEECGAYPERTAPIAIDVFGGAVVSARDFGLGLVILETDRLP